MEGCFHAYVVRSEFGKIYIGQTSNLKRRLDRHNGILPNKLKSYTFKNGKNWELVYKEEFKTRKEAMEREKQLKSYQGRLFIKQRLNNKN